MHILARLRRDEPKIKPEMESDWINREDVVVVGKGVFFLGLVCSEAGPKSPSRKK